MRGLGDISVKTQLATAEPLLHRHRRIHERLMRFPQFAQFIEQRRITFINLPPTTREALISARVGQGLFKQRISQYEHACRITAVNNPVHLIASHIKPWRESNNDERLHEGNGLLLTPLGGSPLRSWFHQLRG